MDEKAPRYLEPLKGEQLPKHVICVDCSYVREKQSSNSDAYTLSLFCGHLRRFKVDNAKPKGGLQREFTKATEFWDIVRSAAKGEALTWIFAYDLKKTVDALRLWDLFEGGECFLDGGDLRGNPANDKDNGRPFKGFCVLENPPSIILFKWADGGGAVKMLDPRNYGVQTKYDLCGRPSGKFVDDTISPFIPSEEMDECKKMSHALMGWVGAWVGAVKCWKLGSFQDTAASQAFSAYRHTYLQEKILVHRDPAVLPLERAAVYGGRCETRFLGELSGFADTIFDRAIEQPERRVLKIPGGLWHLDVNSLYPSVASGMMMPVELTHSGDVMPPEHLHACLKEQCVIAQVEVETSVPCLPVRIKMPCNDEKEYTLGSFGQFDGKGGRITIWPVGRFVTTLAGPELFLAFQYGKVHSVRRFALYRGAVIFDRYVNDLWQFRVLAEQQKQPAMKSIAKALLCGLFGKFIQREVAWQDEPKADSVRAFDAWMAFDKEAGHFTHWRSFCYRVQKLVERGEHKNSVPAIGAYVNSLARVVLWKLLEVAGRENVFYWDTDALICTEAGYKLLQKSETIAPDDLGGLKVVGHYNQLLINGWKYYVADDVVKCAGLPLGAACRRSGIAEVSHPRPVMADLWHGQAPQPIETNVTLPIPQAYRHGKRTPQGWVHPWTLNSGPVSEISWNEHCTNREPE